MSWDVFLRSVPCGVISVKQLGDDYKSELGPKSVVLATLAAIWPEAHVGSAGGVLEGGDFSIELFNGDEDPLQSIMLAIRGGDGAISVIQRICAHTGWAALDSATGDFIDFGNDPAKGLREWRGFRDSVVERLRAQGETVETDVRVSLPGRRRPSWRFWG